MRRYHPILTSAAVRVSRQWGRGASEEIDDIVQEMYLRMCSDQARVLTSFRDPRPEAIFGYLKVTATNIAHDYFRRRSAQKRGAQQTRSIEEVSHLPGGQSDLNRQVELNRVDQLLLAQTQHDNGRRDRTIFRLYYRYGMTAQAIAELPGINLNPKGVEAVLYRLTKALRATLGGAQGLSAE